MAFNYQAIINSVNNFAAKYGLTVYAYTPNFKGIVDAIDNLQNIQFTVEDGTIVNADVNANAAIAGTKINPDFGSQTITTTGNVGIGTTSPAQLLHLTSSGSNAFLQFSDSGSGGSAAQVRIGSNGNDLVVLNNTSSNTATERMRIDSQGRIHLGAINAGSNDGIFNCDINGTKFHLGFGSAFTNYYTTGSNGNHIFRCGTSEKVRIKSSGNLGIGTTNPLSVLHTSLNATDGVGLYLENRADAGSSDAIGLDFLMRRAGGTQFGGTRIRGVKENAWTSTASTINSALTFSTLNSLVASEKMRIDSLGNVGIGTSSPQAISGYTVLTLNNATQGGAIEFKKNGTSYGRLLQGSSSVILETKQSIPLLFNTNNTERMRIDDAGRVYIGHTSTELYNQTSQTGVFMGGTGFLQLARTSDQMLLLNRLASDGRLAGFYQAAVLEGDITVSGTTVSYNGAHLSRWSQLASGTERIEILRGSVLSNLDEMCEWGDEENEQLNRMKVSDVEGDRNVSGVFQCWDDDDDTYTNDFYCAMTGDFVIRIAQGTTVARGDLLMSAGDGTAKPQDDDIVRSKTIAKVTSTTVSETYSDGSYCVPCVLMAC